MLHRTARIPLAIALAILAGCAAPPGRPPETRITGGGEGKVSSDAYGNVSISIAGKDFRVKTSDLKPIGDLTIQAGKNFYTLRDGKFYLPEGALRDVRSNDGAFLRVFVPGYVPKQVWIGQTDAEVIVTPQKVVAIMLAMPPSGGQLKADDGTVALDIGAGMLTKPGTKVAMSTYAPEITAKTNETAAADRSSFLAKVKARTSQSYALAQACEAPDDPLPCPPLVDSTGVMLTVDGPLRPGTMTATLDLDAMLRGWDGNGQPPWTRNSGDWSDVQIAQAKSADKIKRTWAKILRHPHSGDFQAVLAEDYGVRVQNGKLLFEVNVGYDDSIDGVIRTDIEGVTLLGVNLEFTAISSINGALPPVALPPGLGGTGALAGAIVPGTTLIPGGLQPAPGGPLGIDASGLIGNDGSTLIGMDAGSLIGLDGSTLVGLDGGTLIGNDGSTLIGNDGSTLIGLDGGSLLGLGASLIGLDGGSLIGNDGSTLIDNRGGALAGHAELPFAEMPKYKLAAYNEIVWPGQGQARAVTYDGVPLSEWVPIDDQGNFYIYKLPKSPMHFLTEVEIGNWRMTANAIAPKDKLVLVDVNAASTVVAAVVKDKAPTLFDIALSLLSLGGYNQDVKAVRTRLTQQQAQDAVRNGQAGALAGATAVDPLGAIITGAFNLLTAPPLPVGRTETWAGTGSNGQTDNNRSQASFSTLVAIDAKGNGNAVFVLEEDRVREINPGQVRTTFGPMSREPNDWAQADWFAPQFADLQSVGNDLYVSDGSNKAIFKIAPNRTVTTVAVTDAAIGGFHVMGDGSIYATLPDVGKLVKFVGGVRTDVYGLPGDPVTLVKPIEVVAVDADTLLIVDQGDHGVVGFEAGTRTATKVFSYPASTQITDLAVAPDGWCYWTDGGMSNVRRFKIDAGFSFLNDQPVAGTSSGSWQDGSNAIAQFHKPVSIDVDGQHLYIADRDNRRVRRTRPTP